MKFIHDINSASAGLLPNPAMLAAEAALNELVDRGAVTRLSANEALIGFAHNEIKPAHTILTSRAEGDNADENFTLSLLYANVQHAGMLLKKSIFTTASAILNDIMYQHKDDTRLCIKLLHIQHAIEHDFANRAKSQADAVAAWCERNDFDTETVEAILQVKDLCGKAVV